MDKQQGVQEVWQGEGLGERLPLGFFDDTACALVPFFPIIRLTWTENGTKSVLLSQCAVRNGKQ